jgi:hypothetical protein
MTPGGGDMERISVIERWDVSRQAQVEHAIMAA